MYPTVLAVIIVALIVLVINDLKDTLPFRKRTANVNHPPALPQRRTGTRSTAPEITERGRIVRPNNGVSLPERNRLSVNEVNTERGTAISTSGPKGLKPEQFPCCPYCKQRNYVGAGQLITWDRTSEKYQCSRGHSFKRNGRP